jgi:hypothetical protein
MTLLNDRLISQNGLEIARFFDSARTPDVSYDDDGMDMAYGVWN